MGFRWLPRAVRVVTICAIALSFTGAEPADKPAAKTGKFPHLEFDAQTKQIRIECETLGVDTPLEFFAVVLNGPEHESVVRSRVKPSDLHTALLALGMKPGAPVSWSKSLNKWVPPHGPPLQIRMEFEKDGKLVTEPANRWMRNCKTKKVMPTTTWIFAGSRVMNDGNYAADTTGYLVSVVNFDMTVIDIPDLASASNETLEWERNPDTVPAAGTKVTMIIEPAGKKIDGETDAPKDAAKDQPKADAAHTNAVFAAAAGGEEPVSEAKLDEELVARATKKWEQVVGPKAKALREAAQAHYDAINALRREQQRLIDEADRIQRAIDRLERQYQDMTTPQPDLGDGEKAPAATEHEQAPAGSP
jgi:hypothetical protein